MSTFTEDDIRQALKKFTDVPAPAGVQRAAVSRAKRIRVRRAATGTAAAIAALTAAIAAVAMPEHHTNQPGGTESQRMDVRDGWYFASGPTTEGGTRVWNAADARYDIYWHASAWPSPDGTKVAVTEGVGLFLHGPSVGTLELMHDRPIVGAPQWTSSGDQLMFAIDEGDGSVQYRIADVANQKTADVPKLGCGRYCVLVWLPGFQTVGHLESNGTMTAYDLATGHKTGTLKFQAYNATAWSPDGTKIVTDKAVVDQQGRQLCTLNLGNTTRTYWLDSSTFMIMNERVRIVGADCRVQEGSPLPRSWVVTEPSEYTMGHD